MKHTEAASRSGRGIAVRYDGEERRCAIYSSQRNMLILCCDDDGDLWDELDVANAARYRDWRPVNITWYEHALYTLVLRPWDVIAKKVSAGFSKR